MTVDLAQLADHYASMTDGRFDQIARDDLVEEAKPIYDEEVRRRNPARYVEMLARLERQKVESAEQAVIAPSADPKPRLGRFATLCLVWFGGGFLIVTWLFATGYRPSGQLAGFLTLTSFPGLLRFSAYMNAKRAWERRHQNRAGRPHAKESSVAPPK